MKEGKEWKDYNIMKNTFLDRRGIPKNAQTKLIKNVIRRQLCITTNR